MADVQTLYRRWISELWAGRPVAAEIVTDGPVRFTGNDILRLADDGQRFAEYWTGTATG